MTYLYELQEIIQSFKQLKKDEPLDILNYSKKSMLHALSYMYQLPCMYQLSKPPTCINEIPYLFFYEHHIYFYEIKNNKAIFLLNDPRKISIIKQGYKHNFQVYLVSSQLWQDIHITFASYYKIYDIIQKIKQSKRDSSQFKWHQHLIAHIFHMSIQMKASDIHFIKASSQAEILFRIQGHRTSMFLLDIDVVDHVLRRLKVLANLEINNHQDAQDGLFIWKDEMIDETFRLATMPTPYGEQMMLRVIQQEKNMKSLDMLGLTDIQTVYVKQQLHKKQGLIFVSGSTGSGKTTTLYACLKMLKDMPIHIVTLEDPVEIKMEHISQMQLDNNLLRHVMRYDPDVIMIGEIRDEASAKAAIEASLSGHLVLASIHVNHPKDIFKRMKQFHIDQTMIEDASPFMLHHQLIPILCQHCKGKGCIHCMFKGHEKRQLIVDMMHFINHDWQQKGDAYDISLKRLKSNHLIDEKTYEQYVSEL